MMLIFQMIPAFCCKGNAGVLKLLYFFGQSLQRFPVVYFLQHFFLPRIQSVPKHNTGTPWKKFVFGSAACDIVATDAKIGWVKTI